VKLSLSRAAKWIAHVVRRCTAQIPDRLSRELAGRGIVIFSDWPVAFCALRRRRAWKAEPLVSWPRPIDDIVENTGLNSSGVLATLFDLERKGFVRQLPGKLFSMVRF
jgi:hypothetical protein